MKFQTPNIIIPYSLIVSFLISINSYLVDSVNLNLKDKLTKDDLLELDREVTKFYDDNYDQMSLRNISFDDELFRSLRSLRHTIVLHLHDYLYSNEEIMSKSRGAKVDEDLCLLQLKSLVEIAKDHEANFDQNIPITAINFLESSAKTESAALNGNFQWIGSISSCERASISFEQWLGYLPEKEVHRMRSIRDKHSNRPIKGRYCMAHLKAKSWPKSDKYFENRLSIKTGICVPEACHTLQYFKEPQMKPLIDYLTRYKLSSPFNQDDRYFVDYLYCFPDEDSPFRRYDFGTRAFIVFMIVWLLVSVYANIKYGQRIRMIRMLRNSSIDIKMIINQKKDSFDSATLLDSDETDEEDYDKRVPQQEDQRKSSQLSVQRSPPSILKTEPSNGGTEIDRSEMQPETTNEPHQVAGASLQPPGEGAEGSSSKQVTPLPSDIEENDGEFNVIRPVVITKSYSKTRRQSIQKAQNQDNNKYSRESAALLLNHTKPKQTVVDSEIDFVKAFSIKSNIDFLFKTRFGESERKLRTDVTESTATTAMPATTSRQMSLSQQVLLNKRLSQQLNSVSRRTSSSNEALIKELQEDQSAPNNVAIVSGDKKELSAGRLEQHLTKSKRVDVDIFDGIKVFATSYIVLGHTLMFFFGLVHDLRFGGERMFDFTMIAVINALQIVGLFYIITGTLSTYLALSKQKPKQLLQPAFWLLVLVGRYIRLIPTYALVFWFARHVAPYTGAGPQWIDYRTDLEHVRGHCGTQDWSTMVFISAADVKIPYDCVPQAWYLSNDFRTLLIIPFYIILLVLNTYAGYAAIVSTIFYSIFKLNSILRSASIDYKVLLAWQPHVYSLLTDRLHAVYTQLDIRLSTYLLGLIVGHLLYLYETKRIKSWPWWFRAFGLKLALFVAVTSFMGAVIIANPYINQFLPTSDDIDSDTLVILIPLFKSLMEFSICISLLLLATGGGYKWVRKILSSKMAKILSQISYGVFLIHVEVMYKMPLAKHNSDYYILFLYGFFFIATSNIISFAIYVLYEMPINNITRQLFKRLFKSVVR